MVPGIKMAKTIILDLRHQVAWHSFLSDETKKLHVGRVREKLMK
jgi:hypothetical protein